MTTEIEDAIRLANKIMDQPYIDPDGDLCLLARQFLRAHESAANMRIISLQGAVKVLEDVIGGLSVVRTDYDGGYEQGLNSAISYIEAMISPLAALDIASGVKP